MALRSPNVILPCWIPTAHHTSVTKPAPYPRRLTLVFASSDTFFRRFWSANRFDNSVSARVSTASLASSACTSNSFSRTSCKNAALLPSASPRALWSVLSFFRAAAVKIVTRRPAANAASVNSGLRDRSASPAPTRRTSIAPRPGSVVTSPSDTAFASLFMRLRSSAVWNFELSSYRVCRSFPR